MDSNIGKVVTYYEKRQLINSHNSLNKRSREVTWNNKLKTLIDQKHSISTTTISMAIKRGKVITYNFITWDS